MFKKYFLTLLIVTAASATLYSQYRTYIENPWTRDGQIRAHIIQVTPRVTGQIINMQVEDNAQVKRGDLLFEIDPSIYQTNLNKAIANEKQAATLLEKANNEAHRAVNLEKLTPGAQSELTLNNLQNAIDTAEADLLASEQEVRLAEIDVAALHEIAPPQIEIVRVDVGGGFFPPDQLPLRWRQAEFERIDDGEITDLQESKHRKASLNEALTLACARCTGNPDAAVKSRCRAGSGCLNRSVKTPYVRQT